MRTLPALLLVACSAFAQEPPAAPVPDAAAEALFKKVEEKYSTAKTLRYTIAIVAKDKQQESKFELKVAAKGETQFALDGTGTISKRKLTFVAACDGERVNTLLDGQGGRPSAASPNTSELVRAGVVRVGLFECLDYLLEDVLMAVAEKYTVQQLKLEADEKVGERDARVISYAVKTPGRERIWVERLWIDAERHTILKREGKCSDGRTVTEVYTEQTFDGEIPDEDFVVPERK